MASFLKLALIVLAAAALVLVSPVSDALGQEEEEAAAQQPEEADAPQTPPTMLFEDEPVDERAHRRKGWMVGLNLGGGYAEPEVTLQGGRVVVPEKELGVAANLRIGYGFTDKLVVGMEGLGWFKSYTIFEIEPGESFDADVSYSIAGAFVHLYPFGGFYLRGVGGWGWAAVNPRELENVHDQGFGWSAGLGYELRATKTVALGLQLEYGTIGLDSQETTDSAGDPIITEFNSYFVNLTFGVTWYL